MSILENFQNKLYHCIDKIVISSPLVICLPKKLPDSSFGKKNNHTINY